MKKVFITGVAGFLGSHLADKFLKLGHQVHGNDNLIGGETANIPHGVTFYQSDCTDLAAMTKQLEHMDVVIHCAATPYEGLSVFSPVLVVENTLMATVAVVTAAVKNHVKRIVYCSSMARYGNNTAPFTEDMLPAPVDPYGVAKVAGEDIMKSLCQVNGIEWNIAVPHNIVGPKQKYDDPYRNVMSIMLNRCLQGQPPIVYGDGEQMRCFSYVDDCIFCLEQLALCETLVGRTVNIGPDQEFVTINDLAHRIMAATGFDGSIQYVPGRPLEVKHANCSSDLARSLLGYQQQTSLNHSIEQTRDWIIHQGPRPFRYHLPLEIVNEHTPITWKNRMFT